MDVGRAHAGCKNPASSDILFGFSFRGCRSRLLKVTEDMFGTLVHRQASFGKERITSTAKSTHEGVGVTPAAHQTHAWAGSGDSPVPWIRYPSGRGLGGWRPWAGSNNFLQCINYQIGVIKCKHPFSYKILPFSYTMWNGHLIKDRRHSNINTTTKFNNTIIIGCKLQHKHDVPHHLKF
jgi:hypothetical protein